MNSEIDQTREFANRLQVSMRELLRGIGSIPIGSDGHFPYGWRKSAKGRTVWRLLEEIISQNLEKRAVDIGLLDFAPASSEVGVYDFSFAFENSPKIFVNIKSSVAGGRTNKDDISKAPSLHEFFASNQTCILLIATIEIVFSVDPMRLEFTDCYVVPVSWLPDVYVNPSNNGNLQSAKYKDMATATPRTRDEFLAVLSEEIEVAQGKRRRK